MQYELTISPSRQVHNKMTANDSAVIVIVPLTIIYSHAHTDFFDP